MRVFKNSGLISVKGTCKDCDWSCESGATALQATRHFEETGHHIRVEQHNFWERSSVAIEGGTEAKKPAKKKRVTRKKKAKK